MRREDFERAQQVKRRIDNLNQQAAELQASLDKVKKERGEGNAEKLAGLFLELSMTVEGKQAMEAIVGDVLMKIKEQVKTLNEMFDAI
jgi:uncharacterized coiled-coil DUF342 family protein